MTSPSQIAALERCLVKVSTIASQDRAVQQVLVGAQQIGRTVAGRAKLPTNKALTESLNKRVKDLERLEKAKGGSSWIDDLLRRVPWLNNIKGWFETTGKQLTTIVRNGATWVDDMLMRFPAWKQLKSFAGTLGRWGSKGIEAISKFLSHPMVGRFINVLGLAANVFSVFSSIAQWTQIGNLLKEFDKFQTQVVTSQNREFQRLINQVIQIRANANKAIGDASNANKNANNAIVRANESVRLTRDLQGLTNQIRTSNANLQKDLRSQKAQLDGVAKGVAAAITAQAASALIGRAVSPLANRLNKVEARPSIDPKALTSLQGRVGKLESTPNLPPQINQQITNIQQQITNIQRNPQVPANLANDLKQLGQKVSGLERSQSTLPPNIANDIRSINGRLSGLEARGVLQGPKGDPGPQGPRGAPGTPGAPGLTTIVRQEVPITVTKTIVVEKIDPSVKADLQILKAQSNAIQQTSGAAAASSATAATISAANGQAIASQGGVIASISNAVSRVEEYGYKIGNHLGLSRVFQAINLWMSVTILATTSNNIFQLIGSGIDSALNLFGFAIKGPNNESVGASSAVGQAIESVVAGIVGADNYAAGKQKLAELSRINQSLQSIYGNLTSITSTIQNGVAETLERVSITANRDIDDGVHSERVKWNESADHIRNKNPLGRFTEGLNLVESNVSMINSTLSDAVSVKDSWQQLTNDRQQLQQQVEVAMGAKQAEKTEEKSRQQVPEGLNSFKLGKAQE